MASIVPLDGTRAADVLLLAKYMLDGQVADQRWRATRKGRRLVASNPRATAAARPVVVLCPDGGALLRLRPRRMVKLTADQYAHVARLWPVSRLRVAK